VNWTALGESIGEMLQSFTLIVIVLTLVILSAAVHRLSHAVSLLAASRMTEALAQQTVHIEREVRHH